MFFKIHFSFIAPEMKIYRNNTTYGRIFQLNNTKTGLWYCVGRLNKRAGARMSIQAPAAVPFGF